MPEEDAIKAKENIEYLIFLSEYKLKTDISKSGLRNLSKIKRKLELIVKYDTNTMTNGIVQALNLVLGDKETKKKIFSRF